MEHDLIPGDLLLSLRHIERVSAIKEFEVMLQEDMVEQESQRWFQQNSWVLGSEFVRILDERQIDTENIADYLMQAYDGFLDIVEIKRPDGHLRFWAEKTDRGNYYPSPNLTKAITQPSQYICEVPNPRILL